MALFHVAPPTLEAKGGVSRSMYSLGIIWSKHSVALHLKPGVGQATAFAQATKWTHVLVETSIPDEVASSAIFAEQVMATILRMMYGPFSKRYSVPKQRRPDKCND